MLQLDTIFWDWNDEPIYSILDDDMITVHQIDSASEEFLFDMTYDDYLAVRFWIFGY